VSGPPACPLPPGRLRPTARPLEEARGLPPEVYADPAIFAFERAAIFERAWLHAGRAAEVPEPGSCRTAPLTPEGVILARGDDGEVRAFANVCPHRGAPLDPAPGRHGALVCPYHGWRFGLDGRLRAAPHTAELRGFDPATHGLRPVRLAAWQGLLFANPDGAAPPLLEWLDDLPPRLAHLDLGALRPGRSQSYVVAANWKLLAENFAESHHFPLVHPDLERLTPTRGAGSLPARGPWQGGTMELADGVETVSADGALHGRPLLPGTRAEDRRRVTDVFLWPTLLISVQPDYLLTYQLLPLAPRATRVDFAIHFAAAAFSGEACAAPEVYAFWDGTNREDAHICERQQVGVESRGYAPGPYATVEDGVHRFDQMVVRAYGLEE
jgi:Rieske 2Fe-2S family protein